LSKTLTRISYLSLQRRKEAKCGEEMWRCALLMDFVDLLSPDPPLNSPA